MTAILKTLNSVGNFIAKEQWPDRNFCRVDAAVNFTTAADVPAFEVGEVVGRDGATATAPFARLVAGLTGQTEFGIIVDSRVQDEKFFNHSTTKGYGVTSAKGQRAPDWKADTLTVALLVKGDAIVREGGLSFGAAAGADLDVVKAALEAKGVKFQDTLKGKYSTDGKKPYRDPENVAI